MNIKKAVDMKIEIFKMGYEQVKTLILHYMKKPILDAYEEEILILSKDRYNQFENKNKLIAGDNK